MKELRSAYVSACVSPKLKERLEAIAVMENRSLSQVAGWAISEGILLLEKAFDERHTHPEDPNRESSPFFDSAAILAKTPYNAKAIAAKQRRFHSLVGRAKKQNAAKAKATK